MATIYNLFCSILLAAVCGVVPAEHAVVEASLHGNSRRKDSGSLTKAGIQIRLHILRIASEEIGVQEATGNNDGERVEEYLRYTNLGKGYAWCAAFVSWCYGQTGLSEPRNPWSPALFPSAKTYCKGDACRRPNAMAIINPADIFGIYGQHAGRINHVGLVQRIEGKYLVTIEGNSNNRVQSKRRHLSTIYALADWMER